MKRVSLSSAHSSWTSCRTRFHFFLCTRCSNPVGFSWGLSRCQDDTRQRMLPSVVRHEWTPDGPSSEDLASSRTRNVTSHIQRHAISRPFYFPIRLSDRTPFCHFFRKEVSFSSFPSLLSKTVYGSILRICASSW